MFPGVTAAAAAVGIGAFSLLLIVLVAVVVPVAAIAFARSGRGLAELGRGPFSVDFERDGDGEADREEELRQLVEARAFRRETRGEDPGDSTAEIEQLLGLDPDAAGPPDRPEATGPPPPADGDDGLRDEVRQVVLARNESRRRRGESELDVETEIARLLGEAD